MKYLAVACWIHLFGVFLWGHGNCAIISQSQWSQQCCSRCSKWVVSVNQESTALICCRKRGESAGKSGCARKKRTPSDQDNAAETPHWPNYLLFLLTTACTHKRTHTCTHTQVQRQIFVGLLHFLPPLWCGACWHMQWCWLLKNVGSSFLNRCFSTVHLFISGDCIDGGSCKQNKVATFGTKTAQTKDAADSFKN